MLFIVPFIILVFADIVNPRTILQRRWVCFCPSERCFWMESTTNSILEATPFYHLFVKLTLQTGTMFCMLA
ncbi:hypothetical protein C8R42DRAFT_669636 [Lentinula raphanica]|nr:hypothetical protein C8R42DRAFT_669636 [Lentinula raphanica]